MSSYPVRFNFVSSTDRLGVDMKIYLLLFLWIVSGLCVSQAFGYVENVQLETADGRQIFASATNPSTVTAPIGFIHGILQVSSVPVLDSTLKDFVSTETRQADDTTQVVFDGIVVQNQTSVIRVIDDSGNIVYSMIIQPQVDQVIPIPKSVQFGDINTIYIMVGIGASAILGGLIWWKRNSEEME